MQAPLGQLNNLKPQILAEGEALLSAGASVKPGIETTEFWLIAALNLGGLLLVYVNKGDTVFGASVFGILSWIDRQYLATRTAHKADAPAPQALPALTPPAPQELRAPAPAAAPAVIPPPRQRDSVSSVTSCSIMRIYIRSQKLSSCHEARVTALEMCTPLQRVFLPPTECVARYSQSNYHAAWKLASAILDPIPFYFTMLRRGFYVAEPKEERAEG